MSIPINHLVKTLNATCNGLQSFDLIRHDDSFTSPWNARVLNHKSGVVFFVCFQSGAWGVSASYADEDAKFLQNRLNGLTRDDSGAVASTLETTDDGWQIFRNPPLDFVLMTGDEWQMYDDGAWWPWRKANQSLGEYWKASMVPQPPSFQIRRRLQPLPADFNCVPEVERAFKAGDWVVCVDDDTDFASGKAYRIESLVYYDGRGNKVEQGKSSYHEVKIEGNRLTWMVHRFRRARPDEPAIEKQFRPFASAEEFLPFADRWIQDKQFPEFRTKVNSFHNTAVWLASASTGSDWKWLFDKWQFVDGQPCGVEVK